jgi:hypothetical protein
LWGVVKDCYFFLFCFLPQHINTHQQSMADAASLLHRCSRLVIVVLACTLILLTSDASSIRPRHVAITVESLARLQQRDQRLTILQSTIDSLQVQLTQLEQMQRRMLNNPNDIGSQFDDQLIRIVQQQQQLEFDSDDDQDLLPNNNNDNDNAMQHNVFGIDLQQLANHAAGHMEDLQDLVGKLAPRNAQIQSGGIGYYIDAPSDASHRCSTSPNRDAAHLAGFIIALVVLAAAALILAFLLCSYSYAKLRAWLCPPKRQ